MKIEKKLSELFNNYLTVPHEWDRTITGICDDSRQVKPGDLFVAKKGTKLNAKQFMEQAISNGAIAVFTENSHDGICLCTVDINSDIPIITLKDFLAEYGKVVSHFYDNPSQDMQVIGVTGTNGKTSVSHFIAQALTLNKIKCGVLGTLGYGFIDHLDFAQWTTPEPIVLQRELKKLKDSDAKAVTLEVSSHGLSQGRASGVDFDIAIFTNFSRDHLDYHVSMEAYADAKLKLFTQTPIKQAVINIDDPLSQRIIDEVKDTVELYGYSIFSTAIPDKNIKLIKAVKYTLTGWGIIADIESPWGKGELRSSLLGQYNLSNLLAVLATLCLCGVPFKQSLLLIEKLEAVPGRCSVFKCEGKGAVIVDYAHTPDALENTLLMLRKYCEGKLWCVFGCGGDRDTGKRPQMGKVAEQLADYIVLTNDNPRNEEPQKIVSDIIAGFSHSSEFIVEYDRARAIKYAFSKLNEQDILLIAGKGHEDYQLIGDERRVFSDIEYVKALIRS